MAKKKKFYTVSGIKRVCMLTETLKFPDTFTTKKAAAKFVAGKLNEWVDHWNKIHGREEIGRVTIMDCFKHDGYMIGDICLNIVEHDAPPADGNYNLTLTATETVWIKHLFEKHIDEIADLDGGFDYKSLMTVSDKVEKM